MAIHLKAALILQRTKKIIILQSHDGYVHLLPALPGKWSKGHIEGLKTRGAFEVDIYWDNSALTSATIIAHNDGILPLKSPVPLTIKGGMLLKNETINPLLQPVQTSEYLNHSKQELAELNPEEFYTYFLQTKSGERIELKAK